MNRVKEWFKKYFIPHEGNDHQPHILRPRLVAFVVLVALVAELAFTFSVDYLAPRSRFFGEILANALVDETNASRATNNVPALKANSVLTAAAQAKANDMVKNDYFAHTSPQGISPWYWFENAGYSFSYAGENLAVNFSDSQDVTNAWMNSPEHRENILNTDFTEIGMAVAQGEFQGHPATYVVELFGTPSAMAPIAAATPAKTAPAIAAAPAKPATKPKTAPKAAPVVVIASTSVPGSSSQQLFVAVKGAETQAVPASGAASGATAAPVSASGVAAPQSNVFQKLLSDPRGLANDFYYFIAFVFLVGLILNIFIKIRIQYPRLIASGVIVIVIAGLCIMLNQSALASAAIF